jgi:hypothetical protein
MPANLKEAAIRKTAAKISRAARIAIVLISSSSGIGFDFLKDVRGRPIPT